MLKIESAVLLDIEAFVLDLPAQASALVRQAVDVIRSERKVGQPLIVNVLDLSIRIWLMFETFDQIERVLDVLAIRVSQVFSPVVLLRDLPFFSQADFFVVFG